MAEILAQTRSKGFGTTIIDWVVMTLAATLFFVAVLAATEAAAMPDAASQPPASVLAD